MCLNKRIPSFQLLDFTGSPIRIKRTARRVVLPFHTEGTILRFGSQNSTVVPFPTVEERPTDPPSFTTASFTIYNPRPEPSSSADTLKNISKTLSCNGFSIPIPLSLIRHLIPLALGTIVIVTFGFLLLLYFKALDIRFKKTERKRFISE